MFRLLIAIFAVLSLSPIAPAFAEESGDAERGKRVFTACRACHNLTDDQRPRLGPNLAGLFGRKVGTSESYNRYSDALKNADFVWTEEKLDHWLADPRGFLPGNKMTFIGFTRPGDAQKRKDLIAYLRQATATDLKSEDQSGE